MSKLPDEHYAQFLLRIVDGAAGLKLLEKHGAGMPGQIICDYCLDVAWYLFLQITADPHHISNGHDPVTQVMRLCRTHARENFPGNVP